MHIMDRLKPFALLWLRVALAIIFFYHGYQRLFGAPAAAIAFLPTGLPPAVAYTAGSLEVLAAILLVLGLLTRIAALLLAVEMAVALYRVDIPAGGIYAVNNYELSLALCGAAFALVAVGGGLLSMDAATFERSSSRLRTKNKS